MTILNCKMCGGKIQLKGESHGICESCGNEITLPRIDDEARADMYNRGNHFREIGEFDKAYSAYEHIIAMDPTEAEARWCLVLCRYGVNYVEDPRTGIRKPTISRMCMDNILEDPDYLTTLKYSDPASKEIYRHDAQKIDKIVRQYQEVSRREKPYDVFICFKAEELNRERTQASVDGQDIYTKLTAKGLNVFFSRITLEDKLGETYEPYIFAALHSAKVMLLVANNPEQLQARWVKNEWTRYLAMMEKNPNKQLIPVFRDMRPSDFPPEIPTSVQGVDLGRIGAMQDLVRGVCKLTGHEPEPVPATHAPEQINAASNINGGSISIDNLMTRVKQAIEDGMFDEAKQHLEDVLNRDPTNGEAHYYRFLAYHSIRELPMHQLSEAQFEWNQDSYFQRALQYASDERRNELARFGQYCMESQLIHTAEISLSAGKAKEANDALAMLQQAANGNILLEKPYSDLLRIVKLRLNIENDQAAYQEEIGDPNTYFQRILLERYPQEISNYNLLMEECKKNGKYAYKETLHAVAGIIFALLTMTAYIDIPEPYGGANLIAVYLWLIFAVTSIIIDLEPGLGGTASFIGSLVTAWIPAIPITILNVIFGKYIVCRILVALLSTALFALAIYRTTLMAKYKNYTSQHNYEAYYGNIIVQIEDQIWKSIYSKWGDKISEEQLYHFRGYTGCIQIRARQSGTITQCNIRPSQMVQNNVQVPIAINNVPLISNCIGHVKRVYVTNGAPVAFGTTLYDVSDGTELAATASSTLLGKYSQWINQIIKDAEKEINNGTKHTSGN